MCRYHDIHFRKYIEISWYGILWPINHGLYSHCIKMVTDVHSGTLETLWDWKGLTVLFQKSWIIRSISPTVVGCNTIQTLRKCKLEDDFHGNVMNTRLFDEWEHSTRVFGRVCGLFLCQVNRSHSKPYVTAQNMFLNCLILYNLQLLRISEGRTWSWC